MIGSHGVKRGLLGVCVAGALLRGILACSSFEGDDASATPDAAAVAREDAGAPGVEDASADASLVRYRCTGQTFELCEGFDDGAAPWQLDGVLTTDGGTSAGGFAGQGAPSPPNVFRARLDSGGQRALTYVSRVIQREVLHVEFDLRLVARENAAFVVTSYGAKAKGGALSLVNGAWQFLVIDGVAIANLVLPCAVHDAWMHWAFDYDFLRGRGDVWCDGEHVVRSVGMPFRPTGVDEAAAIFGADTAPASATGPVEVWLDDVVFAFTSR